MTALDSVTALERDPVCGMNVNPTTAKYVHQHADKRYYFCCAGCAEKFKAHPEEYLNKPARPGSNLVMPGMPGAKKSSAPSHSAPLHSAAPPIGIRPAPKSSAAAGSPAYVCPMCPEVRESKPGA